MNIRKSRQFDEAWYWKEKKRHLFLTLAYIEDGKVNIPYAHHNYRRWLEKTLETDMTEYLQMLDAAGIDKNMVQCRFCGQEHPAFMDCEEIRKLLDNDTYFDLFVAPLNTRKAFMAGKIVLN